jgi:hypothetical protein
MLEVGSECAQQDVGVELYEMVVAEVFHQSMPNERVALVYQHAGLDLLTGRRVVIVISHLLSVANIYY